MSEAREAGRLGRIAVVSHHHPCVSKGGAENSAYALFKGLLELGEDAIFVAACDHRNRNRLCLDSDREFVAFHDGASYDHLYQVAMPQVTDDLRHILRSQGVAFVNLHHWLFLGIDVLDMIVTELGLPAVLTLHEYLAICHHDGQMVTRPARSLCERASLPACADCFPELRPMQFALRRDRIRRSLLQLTGWVSPSEFLANRFIEWGLDAERMTVIENGILRQDDATAPRAHRPGARWSFGYFGQINEYKGLDVLLRACAIIAQDSALASRIQFNINGTMPNPGTKLHNSLAEAEAIYPFLSCKGAYPNSAVNRLMQANDYVLMLSTWWENSPVVIQEAYGSGRPVICPGLGGMAEKVKDGVSGLHFEPNDPVDLVRAIRDAMEEGTQDRLLSQLPRHMTAPEMARHYRNFFLDCTGGPDTRIPIAAIDDVPIIAQ